MAKPPRSADQAPAQARAGGPRGLIFRLQLDRTIMEEQDRVAVMQQFGRTYRAFMSAFEAQVGHPLPRWRIMLALHQQGGESSQKRLVEQLRVDPGALTRQLKALEGLG